MATVKRLPLASAGALVALVACAEIAGLEGPGPDLSANEGSDGGGAREAAPGIAISPENVTLTTSCVGGGDPAFITLENRNETPAAYELQVPEGSAFALRDSADASVAKLEGTLPAKGLVLVYLRATPTKAGTFGGQVIVRVGERVTQVPVQVTVNGGALAFSPDLIDFGEVRKNTTSQPETIEIVNTGTEPVNLLGFGAVSAADASTDFAIDTGGGSLNLGPGEKATATATMLPGLEGPPVTATFEPKTQEPTCGALPQVTLRGTRVNQDVTVNPVSLDFGSVDCQTEGGATKTITVTNYGNKPVEFDVSTPANSWFEVSANSNTVPAASGQTPATQTVTVRLKALGAAIGSHSDPIDIDVTKPPPSKKTTATATVKSVGAVLSIVPTSLSGFNPNGTKSFSVRNTGNKFVYTRHVSSNAGAFSIVNGTSDNALFPGAILPLNVDVKFVAQANGTHTADITTERANSPLFYPESGNICEPPAVVTATATK